MKKRKRIGEYLIEKGVLSEEQASILAEEAKKKGRYLGDILVEYGYAKENEMAEYLSDQLGIAYIDVRIVDISQDVTALVPQNVCENHRLIPVALKDKILYIAMVDPLDTKAIDIIQSLTKLNLSPLFAMPTAIRDSIKRHYNKDGHMRKIVEEVYQDNKLNKSLRASSNFFNPKGKESPVEKNNLIELDKIQTPVVKLIQYIIIKAVKAGASDIHLEPAEDDYYCRFRIDGALSETDAPPKDLVSAITSCIKIMGDMDIAEKRLPQDGRMKMEVDKKEIDLRVSTFPTIYGEHIVLRILNKSLMVLELEEIGFQRDEMELFRDIICKPYGLILVTGPTGSGKTTTLYAALNRINSLDKNILTLEDPVEYTISRIHQTQVNVKAGLTFATGLRAMVRQDPNIIMIGEIRDRETAEITIHSALTGHLVFSTLHTNNAASTPSRLIDIGVEPFLLASALKGILAQRLVRVLCPKCKEEYQPTEKELELLNLDNQGEKAKVLYRPVGCKDCRNSGYKGRIGIFELLVINEKIRETIIKKTESNVIIEIAQKDGMKTLRENGIDKVLKGITSLAEVLRVTEEV
ncbi:MAG: ATPase, T2SS/T4P/T4SS family [bacterium]